MQNIVTSRNLPNLLRQLVPLLLLFLLLASQPAQAYDVPEQLRSGVTVVHSPDMAPMAFEGLNGEPKGFVIDFWKAWSARTGVPVTFRLMNWQEGLALVRKDETAIHGGLYVTPDRKKYLDYSDALFPMEACFMALKDTGISSVADVRGHVVGVLEKGAGQEKMQRRHPDFQLRSYRNYADLVRGLLEGEVTVVAGDFQTIMYLSGTFGAAKNIVRVGDLEKETLNAAVGKGRAELLGLVAYGLSQIDEEERQDMLDRWFIIEETGGHTVLFMALGAAAVLFLGLTVFYFGSRSMVRRDS